MHLGVRVLEEELTSQPTTGAWRDGRKVVRELTSQYDSSLNHEGSPELLQDRYLGSAVSPRSYSNDDTLVHRQIFLLVCYLW